MSRIHDKSVDCVKSELDLFEAPATQTSFERSDWYEFPPAATLSDTGPLEFYISGAGNEYIDLMHTALYIKAKIVNTSGIGLPKDADVGPVNYFLQSLFSQVEIQLNGKTVTHANSLYPYRSMIEVLMNHSQASADHGYLQAALFKKDTAGSMESTEVSKPNFINLLNGFDKAVGDYVGTVSMNLPGADTPVSTDLALKGRIRENHGFYWRSLFTEGSKWVELMGPIHADIFQQEKFLLNNVDLSVKFTRQKAEFSLMKGIDNDVKVEISDATLFVRKVAISDHVFLAHQQTLLQQNAIYPLTYTVMKSFSIPAGNLSGPQDNIFLGELPQEMVIAFVDNDAYSGNFKKNPFNFKHYAIRYMVAKYGGVQVPAKPFTFSFGNDMENATYARLFYQLCANNGRLLQDKGSLIERQDIPAGYALFSFDFRPDIGCRGHYTLKKTGTVQMDIEFAEPLPQTINMIVFATFDNYLEITSNRDVLMSN